MRKVIFTLMCLFAMMAAGTGLKAQEITITLIPGWTWISNPSTDTLDFATMLGSFTPMQGDAIKSQWGNAYYRNGRWAGSISQFYPGYGYKYYSNRSVPIVLTMGTPLPQLSVTTAEPADITASSAVVGGTVYAPEGSHVFLRGVCWGTTPNPDIDGDHTSDGTGIGSFSGTLEGLSPNTTYYVRAYSVSEYGLAYGSEMSFTTEAGGGSGGDHGYVDLGLPSGLLWATCNVGAETPEDYGDYFAWGETQPKDTYNWSNYQYCNGDYTTLTKYCTNSDFGYNGFTDNLTILFPEDDAATVNWGSDWRMPRLAEWQELLANTTCTWTTQNGVDGRLFTASNGNSLFLPAAGIRDGSSLIGVGDEGIYWSSTLYAYYPYYAWYLGSYSDFCDMWRYDRYYGHSVRAVRSGQNTVPTGAIDGKFTINAAGNQIYFSQGNLQYIGSATTPYWKFADNQWNVLGTTTGQSSSNQNVDRDLFGWGTSGWDNGNTYYHPWDTNNSDDGSSYGPSGGSSLTGSGANADWGVYNPISNGGNQANQWRTLTKNEWVYVFNSRTTLSGIRYAKANVNNVNGVILLPDDWSTSYYPLNDTNGGNYNSNTITADQWSTLEQQGAVFLPAAGYRNGTSVSNVGSSGYYWSASGGSTSLNASCVYFYISGLNASQNNNRRNGLSVRLVAPAN